MARGVARVAGAVAAAPGEVEARGLLHNWSFAGELWRCGRCLGYSHGPSNAPPNDLGCTGRADALHVAAAKQLGHELILLSAERVPLLVCAACGCWATKKAQGLGRRCRGHATTSGKKALRAVVLHGKHPSMGLQLSPAQRRRRWCP